MYIFIFLLLIFFTVYSSRQPREKKKNDLQTDIRRGFTDTNLKYVHNTDMGIYILYLSIRISNRVRFGPNAHALTVVTRAI